MMCCSHTRLRKGVYALLTRMLGRKVARPAVPGVCPICGLLPPGDRMVEYALTIWFVDGDVRRYTFYGCPPERCYRIHDGSVVLHLQKRILSYSLDIVATMEFVGQIVPARPEVPAEVAAAERIIARRNRQS